MRSMTGFGTGTYSNELLRITIEMRAVNQRFLELNIRMPHAYLALEDTLRQHIKQVLHRGKVDVFVTVREIAPKAPAISINYAALTACKDALDAVQEKLFQGEKTTLSLIMNLTKDWFSQEPPVIDTEAVWPVFEQALSLSLQEIAAMRQREGENISRDLLQRADTMTAMIDAIAARKEEILSRYQERLEKKILALLKKIEKVPDEDRLLQEVATYADKVDVTEEVVRFRSHVVQLKEFLHQEGDIGRKLDFLVQEMNREVNTIGSKASDMETTEYVLQLKNEIEKIREQIQNIE